MRAVLEGLIVAWAWVMVGRRARWLEGWRAHRGQGDAEGPVVPKVVGAEDMRRMGGWRDLLRLAVESAAFAGTQVGLSSWFSTWAVRERGLSLVDAGRLLAAAQIGGLVGRILWGWVATRTERASALLRMLGVVMTACGLLLGTMGANLPLIVLYPLVACFGLTVAGWNGVFLAEVARRAGAQEVASATGAVLVVMTGGLGLGPLVCGLWGPALTQRSGYAWSAVFTLGA